MQKDKLEEVLLLELSKRNIEIVANAINDSPGNFSVLWEIIKSSAPPLPSRASWAMTHCCDRTPEIFYPYIDESIDLLETTKDQALMRNILRTLSKTPIKKDRIGELFDLSLSIFETNYPPAVRVHALQILFNISQIETELQQELIDIIENSLFDASTGLKNRGAKLLKKLQKQNKNIK